MRKIRIVCVGKIKEKFLTDGIDEYVKRISRFAKTEIVELADYATEDGTCVTRESDAILSKLKGTVFAMDLGGSNVSSEELADYVEKAYLNADEITFVIGGSRGYDDRVRAKADKRLSFGRVTYPHRLMRLILLEQIYRAFTITANLPYHK